MEQQPHHTCERMKPKQKQTNHVTFKLTTVFWFDLAYSFKSCSINITSHSDATNEKFIHHIKP